MGGLGNQMFQYAAARSLALEKNTWVYLDPSFLYEDAKGKWTQRGYELNAFNIQYKFERSGRVNFLRRVGLKPRWRKWSESSLWPFGFRSFQEGDLKFHPEIFDYPKNTYLQGYFQSEKYFQKHAAAIRNDFSFCEEAKGRNAEQLEIIRNSFVISVHVRRGDYISLPSAKDYHGIMPLQYYTDGAEILMKESTEVPHFFIFSDDIQWVKENLRLPGKSTYVDWNGAGSAAEDLRLMSNCRHHIVANSSFSWWGAWLNPSPEKKVIAPRRWYADPKVDDSDIVPSGWTRL